MTTMTLTQTLGEPAYLALPNFDSFTATIMTLLGSVVMLVLIVRLFTAWAKKNWGEVVVEVIGFLFIGWFVFFPDNAKTTMQELIRQIFGS